MIAVWFGVGRWSVAGESGCPQGLRGQGKTVEMKVCEN